MEKCGPKPTVGETNPAGRKTKTQHQTFPGPCTELCLCVQGAVRRSTSVNIEARVLGNGPANQIPNLSEKGASEGVANGLGLAPAWHLREAESSGGRKWAPLPLALSPQTAAIQTIWRTHWRTRAPSTRDMSLRGAFRFPRRPAFCILPAGLPRPPCPTPGSKTNHLKRKTAGQLPQRLPQRSMVQWRTALPNTESRDTGHPGQPSPSSEPPAPGMLAGTCCPTGLPHSTPREPITSNIRKTPPPGNC